MNTQFITIKVETCEGHRLFRQKDVCTFDIRSKSFDLKREQRVNTIGRGTIAYGIKNAFRNLTIINKTLQASRRNGAILIGKLKEPRIGNRQVTLDIFDPLILFALILPLDLKFIVANAFFLECDLRNIQSERRSLEDIGSLSLVSKKALADYGRDKFLNVVFDTRTEQRNSESAVLDLLKSEFQLRRVICFRCKLFLENLLKAIRVFKNLLQLTPRCERFRELNFFVKSLRLFSCHRLTANSNNVAVFGIGESHCLGLCGPSDGAIHYMSGHGCGLAIIIVIQRMYSMRVTCYAIYNSVGNRFRIRVDTVSVLVFTEHINDGMWINLDAALADEHINIPEPFCCHGQATVRSGHSASSAA